MTGTAPGLLGVAGRAPRSGRALRAATAWTIAEVAATLLGTITATFIVARIIGPSATGLAAMAAAVMVLAQPFCAAPFASALVQRNRLGEGDIASVFWFTLGLAVIFAGIVAAAGVAAGDALGPGVAPLLAVLALTLPASAAEGVAAAVLVRRFDTRALALRSIAAQAAAVITGIAIALHGGGAWSVVGQQLAFYAVSAVLAVAMVPLRPGLPRLDLRPLVEMRGFAFASVLGAVVQRGGMRIFLLLVAAGAPPALAGLLQIAFRFTEMARDLPLSLLQRFALPALSRLRGDRAAFARWTEALLLLSGLLLATLLAGLAAVAGEMQVLLLGPAWVEVVGPVQVLAGALALCAARLPLPTVLAAAGHPGALLRHSVFGLTAMAAAVLILRPADATGAASLWVLSFAVPAVAGLVVASRRLGLRVLDQLQGWALSLLPAAAMLTVLAGFGAAGLMPIAALPALATKILLGAGVALAFAVPLGWPAWRVLLHRTSR